MTLYYTFYYFSFSLFEKKQDLIMDATFNIDYFRQLWFICSHCMPLPALGSWAFLQVKAVLNTAERKKTRTEIWPLWLRGRAPNSNSPPNYKTCNSQSCNLLSFLYLEHQKKLKMAMFWKPSKNSQNKIYPDKKKWFKLKVIGLCRILNLYKSLEFKEKKFPPNFGNIST